METNIPHTTAIAQPVPPTVPMNAAAESAATAARKGGKIMRRHFTRAGMSPFDAVTWERRAVAITNERGEVVFEQKDVEVPNFWSAMALKVVASRYLHGEVGTPGRETGVRALVTRVVRTIAEWGMAGRYFRSPQDCEIFRDELAHVLLHQYAAFNSPVWFNVGVHPQPQCSACFIVSVDDSMESLLDLQRVEGLLFKYGSGTGTNLSTIRSSKEKLSGGGTPSGPVSFMRGFDSWAGSIKSGGKTRRAAKMQILNATHPDILEFIACKSSEEKKAWALIEAGYDGSFAAAGGAYESVSFQNANLSVRVDDEFMRAAKGGSTYWTRRVSDGAPCEELDAAQVLRRIAEGTHVCGDPGMQFDTTINAWHTTPHSGRINASNPCSEYMHVDNSACNLASINLLKFLSGAGDFDCEAFTRVTDLLITAQDILIDNSSYPTAAITKNARDFRQLGLGYANLGALLMSLGLPYNSEAGREWAAAITALMTGQAYESSAELAQSKGAFAAYSVNRDPMIAVIEKHRNALRSLEFASVPDVLSDHARAAWDRALSIGREHGFRNAQVSVLAPTGTISFMMDCDTTGIEPDIALVKYKSLAGGGLLKMVNGSVRRALQKLGYDSEQQHAIIAHIENNDTIEGAPELRDEHLAVFDCAFRPRNGSRSIHYLGHLKMMGAVQPFISGAISKTVNLPQDVSVDEIFEVYVRAWELGLKAVALYRDGSKRTQPLSTGQQKQQGQQGTVAESRPVRRRLADERQSITHKFQVGGLEGYLTVGLFDDGTPGEIFLVVAKEGSTLSGIMDAFATAVSIALQYGVPLVALVRKFSHLRFEPSGFTTNKEIPIAKSIVDYVFRWMALKFLSEGDLRDLGLKGRVAEERAIGVASGFGHDRENSAQALFENSMDAPPCTACGSSLMVRQAGCYVCLNCGAQGGCG